MSLKPTTAELANRIARASSSHAEAEAHPLFRTFRLAFARDAGRLPTGADAFDAVNAPDVF
ncbi:hypothetical protein [Streptomyces sp. DH10]|uniref:hypothetical protein n=1 Tax=Streptomyces sp. DH10 TaxID=3040121 RepID=UPI002441D9E9|nr:hypothetical protein [Streptomyces sp. DH10]MDG9713016.1 hypothetical protein [Streptomyces sp. DH10]